MRFILFLLLIFTFHSHYARTLDTTVVSQDSLQYDTGSNITPVDFNAEEISKYKEQDAFSYLNASEEDNWWTRFKKWLDLRYRQLMEWIFGDYQANTFLSVLLRILPYIIIGAVIGFIVWLFIRLDPGKNLLTDLQEPTFSYNDEEKIVRSTNIPQLIEEALQQGNYRLAIRYHYLLLLKQLNDHGVINYESQKTNTDYLREIKRENLKQQLQKIIRIYDFSWYGGFSISEDHFLSAKQSFLQMEGLLKAGNNE